MGEHRSLRPPRREIVIRTDLDYAREADDADELAPFRDQFIIAEPDLIYLDGNSLGRLPRRTAQRIREVVEEEWGRQLIRGWNAGWFEASERLGAKVAKLVAARADEVLICDSTSVNLFKLIVAALVAKRGRRKIVTDELNFPSDLYVIQSAVQLMGGDRAIELVRSPDGMSISLEEMSRAIDDGTALVALTHVAFKSAAMHDLEAVTALAHRHGAMMLWDLSHSVGAMPIELGRAGVDLAVGCTYKYLNGGPGAPAFLYVRRDLQEQLTNPIGGWFGQRNQFEFELEHRPAAGLRRFLIGTPPILSLQAVEPGIDLVIEAGVDRIRAKSERLTEYVIGLWYERLRPLGVQLRSPREANRRGSHVSFGHPAGRRIARAMVEHGVIPDFRRPDNIRLGVAPLYTSFREVREAMLRFERILRDRLYEQFEEPSETVT